MIPLQFALRRRMMGARGGGAPISELPLGTLIRIADSDGGEGAANYEIADINNFVSGGVVLVRKYIYGASTFGSTPKYPNSELDNAITTIIYDRMPKKLRDKMMDVSFNLYGSGDITRKMFAPTITMMGFGNNNEVAEGKALQLYTSNDSRIKTYNGTAVEWWLSSFATSVSAYCILSGGSPSNIWRIGTGLGVVPAFAIPSKTPYNATPNTDGSYNLF